MAKATWHSVTDYNARQAPAAGKGWLRSMSDHVATALLVYTGLLIFATMTAMKQAGGPGLALFGLVVLVAVIIPMFRNFERRWERKVEVSGESADLRSEFRRQTLFLWLLAIGLPFAVTALAWLAISAAG